MSAADGLVAMWVGDGRDAESSSAGKSKRTPYSTAMERAGVTRNRAGRKRRKETVVERCAVFSVSAWQGGARARLDDAKVS
jgi:hypothetical protein